MGKIIMVKLLLGIIMLTKITFAQPYESVFGNDTTQWSVVYHIPDYFPTIIFKTYGDTLINGKKYVPIYMGYYYSPLEPYGYLKEDRESGRLWFRSLDGQEELIMDLSIAKNDTFYFYSNNQIPYKVDTVYYDSGRKVVSFDPIFSDPVKFIEGVGPTNLFYSLEVDFPDYAKIRCLKKDNALIYIYSDNGTCLDTFSVVSENPLGLLQIYPNPTERFVNISSNIMEEGILRFLNDCGTCVYTIHINENCIQVDLGFLPNGVYFVEYNIQQKKYITKILKK